MPTLVELLGSLDPGLRQSFEAAVEEHAGSIEQAKDASESARG